jgi:hypothetical protein
MYIGTLQVMNCKLISFKSTKLLPLDLLQSQIPILSLAQLKAENLTHYSRKELEQR